MLNEDEAKIIKRLEDAACDHGVVMDILGLIEDWQQTGQIPPEDMRLFELAAIAAPLCRQERIRREIDKE